MGLGAGALAGLAVSGGAGPEGDGARLPDAGFWSGRRVLLTGHTGFKGSWLALWLGALGADVVGFARGVPTEPSLYALARVGEHMSEIEGDICDAEAVTRAVRSAAPEVIVHMAAQPIVRAAFERPLETYATNVMGTANILEAVRVAGEGVRVLVNVTSDKCYENREWEWGYREDEPMGGHDPYSSSKGAAELVTSAFRRSYFHEPGSPRIASARAGNVIGGGDWGEDRLVPDLMRAALDGAQARIRNPNAVRPWQHVLCPLSGYLVLAEAAWESADCAAAWNFGPEERDARPVGWVVERICELWPGGLDWAADEGPHPHEARYLKLDSSRARTRLRWAPPMDLDDALAATVAWFDGMRAGADMRELTLEQIAAAFAPSRASAGRHPAG